jgi:hypothetical protein
MLFYHLANTFSVFTYMILKKARFSIDTLLQWLRRYEASFIIKRRRTLLRLLLICKAPCAAVSFIDLYAENMAKNVTIASQDLLALSLDEC